MQTIVEVDTLRKEFPGGTVAVDGISLGLDKGEVVTFLGPSGCGKTTTLRCIAGLEVPTSGQVVINGTPMFRPTRRGMRAVPPEERGLSMVFQQYALWPHMDVLANVAYGLVVRKRTKADTLAAAERALRLVRLWELRDRKISQLSGGQQQRVALARALAFDPPIVLLDEPLSNLDAKLREELRIEFIELQQRLGFAAVYVTHDQHEAIGLSDRIVIMNRGRIEQVGRPREVWGQPATAFVAEFIGESNKVSGVITDGPDGPCLRTDHGPSLSLSPETGGLSAGRRAVGYVPFSGIELAEPGTAATGFDGTVTLASFQGHSMLVKVAFGAGSLAVRTDPHRQLEEGQSVRVTVPAAAVRCFPLDEVAAAEAAAEPQPDEAGPADPPAADQTPAGAGAN
jgi:ABC-type Fe3+/spermidine/putrescine transport system ATPase subunit